MTHIKGRYWAHRVRDRAGRKFEIYVINADRLNVTNHPAEDWGAAWTAE